MNVDLLSRRYDDLQKADDLERTLGDTLDVKASVVLVVITFLGTLSQGWMNEGFSLCWKVPALFATGLLAVSGVVVLVELWPRLYSFQPLPAAEEDWIKGLGEGEGSLLLYLEGRIQRTAERVQHNQSVNAKKSHLLSLAFYFLIPAVAVDIAILMLLGLRAILPI